MKDQTIKAPPESETPLTGEEQAFLQAFLGLPPQEVVQGLGILQRWAQASGARKAIALKLLDAGLSDKAVARLCGLSDRQLRRYPEYRAFVRLLKEGNRPARGVKQTDSGIEAWEEDE
jgi:hypothetical protein